MGFGGSGIAFQPESFEETDYTTLQHWLRSKTTRKNGLAEISVSM
jgi:hypothetical protein